MKISEEAWNNLTHFESLEAPDDVEEEDRVEQRLYEERGGHPNAASAEIAEEDEEIQMPLQVPFERDPAPTKVLLEAAERLCQDETLWYLHLAEDEQRLLARVVRPDLHLTQESARAQRPGPKKARKAEAATFVAAQKFLQRSGADRQNFNNWIGAAHAELTHELLMAGILARDKKPH